MKFKSETPSCRTLHAFAICNERLMIYGGTDGRKEDADINDLWMLQPLLKQPPTWQRLKIVDPNFILPDSVKRHQLVVRKNAQ